MTHVIMTYHVREIKEKFVSAMKSCFVVVVVLVYIPFIVGEFISMVIRRNNVHQENIFSFGV